MGEVPASVRSYLEPIFFYAMSCELRAARGKVFDHSPEVRRYMGIEQYEVPGKVFTFDLQVNSVRKKRAAPASFRCGPLSIAHRFARLRQPAAYLAS